MERKALLLAVVTLVTMLLVAPGIALADEDVPLADAGLDQTVTEGATVHLDGGGSLATDGELVTYEWTVRNRATDETMTHTSDDTTWTFEATDTAGYDVTLTVTDDAGRSASDTLYVDVDPAAPPDVTLSGPDEAEVGESAAFEATIEPGDAPVERLRWDVENGNTIENPDNTETTTVTPPSTEVSEVRVVVTDANDNTGVATLDVDVVDPDDDGQDDGSWTRTDADRDDPVIRGPQVVDGEHPLDASHELDSDISSRVADVTWAVDGDRVSTGDELDRTWTAGTRELHANVQYQDGSAGTAVFADGSRDVLVNPKPEIQIRSIRGQNEQIDGIVEFSDDGVGLDTVEVNAGDDHVQREDALGRADYGVEFDFEGFENEGTYELTMTATDEAGQTRVVTREVEIVATPEITRAEAVNDPVDSYHSRIDRDRYAAELVVEVELHGHDAEDVELGKEPVFDYTQDVHLSALTLTERTNETATFRGEHAVENAETVDLRIYAGNDDPGLARNETVQFEATPSPPEIRVSASVIDEAPNVGTRMIEVDASDSFHPDDRGLTYYWGEFNEYGIGTSTYTLDGTTIDLYVEDGNHIYTHESIDLTEHYNPELNDVFWHNDVEKIFPTEDAQFTLRSEDFLSGRGVNNESEGWNTTFSQPSVKAELAHDRGGLVSLSQTDVDGNEQSSFYWSGSATIPAKSFLYGMQPEVRTYNVENPEQTERTYQLPTPEIETDPESGLRDLLSIDIEFLVMERSETTRLVGSFDEVQLLTQQGYTIEETHEETRYTVEEHIQRDPTYETETRTFGSAYRRNMFVSNNRGWSAAGSETESWIETSTRTVWSSSPGRGTRTGNTREVEVVPKETETEYQYRSQLGPTYWSTSPRNPADVRIGSRERTVQQPVYNTEYEVRITDRERVSNTEYFAERSVMVDPGVDRWETILETTDRSDALRLVQNSHRDRELSTETHTTYWELERMTDIGKAYVDSVSESDRLIHSESAVTARMEAESSSTGEVHDIGIHQFNLRYESMISKDKIREQAKDDIDSGNCVFESVEFECSIEGDS